MMGAKHHMDKLFGILWDMDGVLVDTGEFHYRSWAITFAENGITFTREKFRQTFGMNNAGILKLLLASPPTPALITEIGDQKEALFRQMVMGSIRPLPGVLNLLPALKEKGFRQVVASSAPQENIDVLLDELGIVPFFDAVVSGAKIPGKPEPDVFLEAANMIDVTPANCLVIEDAIAGVIAAKRAGMKCLAVTTTNPATVLGEADLIVDSLVEVSISLINQLFIEEKK
jgi:HAD superfamily hydrolase (TIGR01509 family)